MSRQKSHPVQYMLRLTEELRDKIKANAAANRRPMNAEIIAQLNGEQRTLRDWFAGQALAGMTAHQEHGVHHHISDTVHLAYRYADAMLAERAKGGDA